MLVDALNRQTRQGREISVNQRCNRAKSDPGQNLLLHAAAASRVDSAAATNAQRARDLTQQMWTLHLLEAIVVCVRSLRNCIYLLGSAAL